METAEIKKNGAGSSAAQDGRRGGSWDGLLKHAAPEGPVEQALPKELLAEICSRWIPGLDAKMKEAEEAGSAVPVLEHGFEVGALARKLVEELACACELPAAEFTAAARLTVQDLWNIVYTLETLSCISASNVLTWNPGNGGVRPGLLFTPWRPAAEPDLGEASGRPGNDKVTSGLGGRAYREYKEKIDARNGREDPAARAGKIMGLIPPRVLAAAGLDEPSNLFGENFPVRLRELPENARRWGGVPTLASPFESDSASFSGSALVKGVRYSDEAFRRTAEKFLSHEKDVVELYTVMMRELGLYLREQTEPGYFEKAGGPGGAFRRHVENLAEDAPRYASLYKFIDADLWKNYDYIMRDFRLNDDSDYLLGRLRPGAPGAPPETEAAPSSYRMRYFDLSRGEPMTGISAGSRASDGPEAGDSDGTFKTPPSEWNNALGFRFPEKEMWRRFAQYDNRWDDFFTGNITSDAILYANPNMPDHARTYADSKSRYGIGDPLLPNRVINTHAPDMPQEELDAKFEAAAKIWRKIGAQKKSLSLDVAARALSDLEFHLADLKAEFAACRRALASGGPGLQEAYEEARTECGYELNGRPPKQRFFLPEVFGELKDGDYEIEFDEDKLEELVSKAVKEGAADAVHKPVSAVAQDEQDDHLRGLFLSLHTLLAYAVDVVEGREPLLAWNPDLYSSARGHTASSVLLTGTPGSEATLEKAVTAPAEELKKLDYMWKPDVIREKYKFTEDGKKPDWDGLSTIGEWNEFEKCLQSPNFRPYTDRCDELTFRELIVHGGLETPLRGKESEKNGRYVLGPRIVKWRLRNTLCGSGRLKCYRDFKKGGNDAARRAAAAYFVEFCRAFASRAPGSNLDNWKDGATASLLRAAASDGEARERLMYTAAAAWQLDKGAVYLRKESPAGEKERARAEKAFDEAEEAAASGKLSGKTAEDAELETQRMRQYLYFVDYALPRAAGYFNTWYINDPWMFMPDWSIEEAALLYPGRLNILDSASRLVPLLRAAAVPKSPVSGLRLYDVNPASAELLLYMRNRRMCDFMYNIGRISDETAVIGDKERWLKMTREDLSMIFRYAPILAHPRPLLSICPGLNIEDRRFGIKLDEKKWHKGDRYGLAGDDPGWEERAGYDLSIFSWDKDPRWRRIFFRGENDCLMSEYQYDFRKRPGQADKDRTDALHREIVKKYGLNCSRLLSCIRTGDPEYYPELFQTKYPAYSQAACQAYSRYIGRGRFTTPYEFALRESGGDAAVAKRIGTHYWGVIAPGLFSKYCLPMSNTLEQDVPAERRYGPVRELEAYVSKDMSPRYSSLNTIFRYQDTRWQNVWWAHAGEIKTGPMSEHANVLPTAQEKIHRTYAANYPGALPMAASMIDNMLRVGVYGRYEQAAAIRSFIAPANSPGAAAGLVNARVHWSPERLEFFGALSPEDLKKRAQTKEEFNTEVNSAYMGGPGVSSYALYLEKHKILNYSALHGRYAFLPLMHTLRRHHSRKLMLDVYQLPERTVEVPADPEKLRAAVSIPVSNYASPFDVRTDSYDDEPEGRFLLGPELGAALRPFVHKAKEEVLEAACSGLRSEELLFRSGDGRRPDGFNWEDARFRCLAQDVAFTVSELRRKADPSCRPLVSAVSSLNPLMRTDPEAERPVELDPASARDRALYRVQNVRRNYGSAAALLDYARTMYPPFRETLTGNYSREKLGIYAAWQSEFLSNAEWLERRYTTGAGIFTEKLRPQKFERVDFIPVKGACWCEADQIGSLREHYKQIETQAQHFIDFDKKWLSRAYNRKEYKEVISPLSVKMEDLNNAAYQGSLPSRIASNKELSGIVTPSYGLGNYTFAPAMELVDPVFMNPGSIIMKYAAGRGRKNFDRSFLYRGERGPWVPRQRGAVEKLWAMRPPGRLELLGQDVGCREFAAFWTRDRNPDSYFAGGALEYAYDFTLPYSKAAMQQKFISERLSQKLWNLDWDRADDPEYVKSKMGDKLLWQCLKYSANSLLTYRRALWGTRKNYPEAGAVRDVRLNYFNLAEPRECQDRRPFIIAETLAELRQEDPDGLYFQEAQDAPGDYAFTVQGSDDFAAAKKAVAIVTDPATLEKVRIEARSPYEAARAAAAGYRNFMEHILPPVGEGLDRAMDCRLSRLTQQELEEMLGEEDGAEAARALRSIFCHTDYFPGAEETALLRDCAAPALEKAVEQIYLPRLKAPAAPSNHAPRAAEEAAKKAGADWDGLFGRLVSIPGAEAFREAEGAEMSEEDQAAFFGEIKEAYAKAGVEWYGPDEAAPCDPPALAALRSGPGARQGKGFDCAPPAWLAARARDGEKPFRGVDGKAGFGGVGGEGKEEIYCEL